MPYAPTVNDRSGEIMAQGINRASDAIANGLREYQHNKLMTGQAIAKFEAVMKANPEMASDLISETPQSPSEVTKAFLKLQKGGSVGLRDASLLSSYADTIQSATAEKQRAEMQKQQMAQQQFLLQQAQQQKAQEDALNARLQQYAQLGSQQSTGVLNPQMQRSVKQFMDSPIADVVQSGARVTPQMISDYALKTKPTLDSRAEVAGIRAESAAEAAKLRQAAFDASAEAKAAKAEAAIAKDIKKDSKQAFDESRELRNDFRASPNVKNFDVVKTYYDRGLRQAGAGTAAGDMGLIFSLMKVYDPTSAVREQEYANASNTGSAWQKFGNVFEALKSGQKLQPEQRKQFMDQMKEAALAQHTQLLSDADQFSKIAKKRGLDSEEVVNPDYISWQPKELGVTPVSAPPAKLPSGWKIQ